MNIYEIGRMLETGELPLLCWLLIYFLIVCVVTLLGRNNLLRDDKESLEMKTTWKVKRIVRKVNYRIAKNCDCSVIYPSGW